MKKMVVPASALVLTMIYGTDPKSSFGRKFNARVKKLSELLTHDPAGLDNLDVIAAAEPDTGRLLVYKGNIEVLFARDRGMEILVSVMTSSDELLEVESKNPGMWYGVTNFNTLLRALRIGASCPELSEQKKRLSKADKDFLTDLRLKQQDRAMQDMAQMAGWYDDDE